MAFTERSIPPAVCHTASICTLLSLLFTPFIHWVALLTVYVCWFDVTSSCRMSVPAGSGVIASVSPMSSNVIDRISSICPFTIACATTCLSDSNDVRVPRVARPVIAIVDTPSMNVAMSISMIVNPCWVLFICLLLYAL